MVTAVTNIKNEHFIYMKFPIASLFSVTIDGGGMRGIVALEMLKTIERTTG